MKEPLRRIVIAVVTAAKEPVSPTHFILYCIIISMRTLIRPPFPLNSFRSIRFRRLVKHAFITKQTSEDSRGSVR